jgi:membrane protease subunit HflK
VASRLLQEAEGYKQAVTANAQGDAARFRQIEAEYSKAPQVTRQRMYLDTLQTVMNNTSKIIVDQKGGNSLLYLPLDKLQHLANPSSAAPEVIAQPPTPAAVPQSSAESRSRDAFRSREREERP